MPLMKYLLLSTGLSLINGKTAIDFSSLRIYALRFLLLIKTYATKARIMNALKYVAIFHPLETA
jgi:hypothetical protein